MSRTVDPLVTLQVGADQSAANLLGTPSHTLSSTTGVCFLPSSHQPLHEEEDDDSSDEEEVTFRCRSLALQPSNRPSTSASLRLRDRYLASCHANGDTFLWDLSQQKNTGTFTENRGPGLMLRRADDTKMVYQTRDEQGIVSLHDCHRPRQATHQFSTESQGFCAAAPCTGNPNLIALPSSHNSVAVVRDWRQPASVHPVAIVACANQGELEEGSSAKMGMMTSLAMAETNGRTILACGTESGHVLLHDLIAPRSNHEILAMHEDTCRLQLTKDPILALDIAPSILPSSSDALASVVVAAGMAGDAIDLSERPETERGTVALIKATVDVNASLQARVRSRMATCTINDANSESVLAGKPGVSTLRFRPDGRLVAVGGWDKRLRIFNRASSSPLAILRGHAASVNAIDWAPDAANSGLLASGAPDGRVYIWQCFATDKNEASLMG